MFLPRLCRIHVAGHAVPNLDQLKLPPMKKKKKKKTKVSSDAEDTKGMKKNENKDMKEK